VDRELFASLCNLRREIAGRDNIPPYVVFGDATLRDMARRRPTTLQGLLRVHGVGQQKSRDYGDCFLQHVTAHCTQRDLTTDVIPQLHSRAEKRSHLNASAIAAFPYFRNGASVEEVAAQMGRAESTVYGYLEQYMRHERIDDPFPWVARDTAARVRQAIDVVGRERLKIIFDQLDGSVAYHQIRLVLACLDNA
jgi:ATP-dependent DNA helicase RecQ